MDYTRKLISFCSIWCNCSIPHDKIVSENYAYVALQTWNVWFRRYNVVSRTRQMVYIERENRNENDTNTRPSITIRPIFVTPCAFHFSKCVVNVVYFLSQMPLCKYVNRICAQHFANWGINDRKCCTFIDYLYVY